MLVIHRCENLRAHTVILYKTVTATNHTIRCYLSQEHRLNFLVFNGVAQYKLNSPVT